MDTEPPIDALDRRLIQATQAGLPLVERPYHHLAGELGVPAEDVSAAHRMLDAGIIRRIGVVPNHYVLGYRANGMSVWDVPDEDSAGSAAGSAPWISLPRLSPAPPSPDVALQSVRHGARPQPGRVEAKVAEIAELIGPADRGHPVLYSTRILKKTGLRIVG